jgi:outer membrane biosynthesis protein TonB
MSKRRSSRRVRALRTVTLAASFAIVTGVAHYGVAQQEERVTPSLHAPTPGDEPAVGNAADYEVLRKLLGVSEPAKPAAPQALEAAEPEPVEALSVDPVPARAPAARPQPVSKRVAPVKKAVAKAAPKAKPVAASKQAPDPATPAASTGAAPVAESATEPVALASIAPSSVPFSPDTELPPTGAVLRGADYKRWEHLLGPSVQWALLRGAEIRVGEHKPIREEAARAAATQRYSAQVELTPDRKDMKNFVAGIPFPLVTKEDPDAGVKIILNQQSRLIVDDVDARKMGCHLGEITPAGMKLERTFQVEHWRRLFYVGRLYHQPAPTWENQEKIRYRELQYPLIEPFDLKGGGWNYIRYLDVGRPDDGWIYYPLTRRVRRISTAQRSQGFFGQDMDLDSFTGYAGNPAWMEWRLVGQKTMLAPMHAEHTPVKWQAPPADFAADEPWEPREVFVVEGRSLLREYAFARRVVYVDRESWLIPYSEIYDDQGKLWKALHQTWGFGQKVREDAGGKSFEEFYLPGYAMIDMQIDHITRCELPLSTAVGDRGWYYNYGAAEGTSEEAFDIVSLIGQNH